MRPANTVHALALATLDSVAAYYVEEGFALPERQVVSAGPPAWDCELAAVWVERTGPHGGDISREQATPLVASVGSMLRSVTLVVTICRCIPDVVELDSGSIRWPSPEDVTEGGRLMHYDEPLVAEAIRAGATAGRLPDLNDWSLLDWKIVGPMGGYAASEMRLKVSSDWIPPTVGS